LRAEEGRGYRDGGSDPVIGALDGDGVGVWLGLGVVVGVGLTAVGVWAGVFESWLVGLGGAGGGSVPDAGTGRTSR
jgi:hypothetical protein